MSLKNWFQNLKQKFWNRHRYSFFLENPIPNLKIKINGFLGSEIKQLIKFKLKKLTFESDKLYLFRNI